MADWRVSLGCGGTIARQRKSGEMTVEDARDDRAAGTAMGEDFRRKTTFYSAIFFAFLVLFYGSLYLLWIIWPVLYHQVMTVLSIGPASFPFSDAHGWLSWIECRARGYDVLASNACDPLNHTMNYSPIFLDLPAWLQRSDTQAVGLATSGSFLLTLPFLLRPSSLPEFCTACVAAVSTSVIFAVERANIDVLIFTLVAAAILLRRFRTALPYSPYAIFLVGGLLKFYPLVLLSTSIRERPWAFVAVVAASAIIVSGVAFVHWAELGKILGSQPPFIVWGDTFGARELPIGFAYFIPNIEFAPLLAIECVCIASFCFAARIFVRLRDEELSFQSCGSSWDALVFGSLLIVGCFFSGQNAGYRSIFLLLLLPGLRDMATGVSKPGLKAVLSATQIAVFLLLWKDFFRRALEELLRPTGKEHGLAQLPYFLFFVLRELNWWFIIAVASAVAAVFFYRSHTFRWTVSLLQRAPQAAG